MRWGLAQRLPCCSLVVPPMFRCLDCILADAQRVPTAAAETRGGEEKCLAKAEMSSQGSCPVSAAYNPEPSSSGWSSGKMPESRASRGGPLSVHVMVWDVPNQGVRERCPKRGPSPCTGMV